MEESDSGEDKGAKGDQPSHAAVGQRLKHLVIGVGSRAVGVVEVEELLTAVLADQQTETHETNPGQWIVLDHVQDNRCCRQALIAAFLMLTAMAVAQRLGHWPGIRDGPNEHRQEERELYSAKSPLSR